ncbi:MAG: DNA polymerase IV [Gemmatimonadaceae bacterium]
MRPDSAPQPPVRSSDALPRRILLVDADAFFVAVARMVDPEGAGKAKLLIVGGAPGSRGVVCSASYEARQFGVRSAMPIARAVRLCPQAMCVPVPRGACGRKSREISAVLHRFAPVVQAASIDEWYLDLSGTEALYRGAPLAEVAHQIRDAVHAATGITVSLGGGTNKLIAKLAVEFGKPKPGSAGNGVFVVAPGAEGAFMEQVALGDIPGVGPRLRDRLDALGLRAVRDVIGAGIPALERMLGERAGRWLHERARGIGSVEVVAREQPKSVSHEDTFHDDVNDDAALGVELVRLVTKVASDLRAKELSARTITVKIKDGDFRIRSASRTLASPVVADRVILEVARELLLKLRNARRTPARLLGVGLSGLGEGEESEDQLSLFGDAPAATTQETAKDRALATAVDTLRARFGADAIVPGRLTSSGARTVRGAPQDAPQHAARGAPRDASRPPAPNASPAAEAPRPGRGPGARPSGR